MNPIKKIIKGTRVFQYIRCKEEFDRIRNRNPEIKGNMKAVFSYKSNFAIVIFLKKCVIF